jgi:hypothetical protein
MKPVRTGFSQRPAVLSIGSTEKKILPRVWPAEGPITPGYLEK